jgi:hypothetical protein
MFIAFGGQGNGLHYRPDDNNRELGHTNKLRSTRCGVSCFLVFRCQGESCAALIKKVAPRFELGMKALQAPALPLGYATLET